MIDHPALTAGIVIRRPESAAGMLLDILAQPSPQGRVRIVRRSRDGLMALSGAVLPGHAAGEPLTDPQHPLEVVNGRPPALRAWKFPFAISLGAALSNSASANNLLSVAFSRSRSFKRLASSAFRPPN